MFVLSNTRVTQLVSLRTQTKVNEVYEQVAGQIEEVDGLSGQVVAIEELQATLELLACDPKPIPSFEITGFSTSTGVQEIGAQVVTPAFTASYDATPNLAELDDSDGNPTKDVSSTPNAFSSDGTFQETVNNALVTFTLSAARGALTDQAQTSIAWRPRTYWGVGGSALLSEAEIEVLANNQLDNNYNHVFSIGPMGPAEWVWYCFPQSYDPGDGAQFQVGPFIGGFYKAGVVSVTNANGVTQDYACWRSDFPGLDAITVTVF